MFLLGASRLEWAGVEDFGRAYGEDGESAAVTLQAIPTPKPAI